MIRETYKGRKLKAVKGNAYGKSRISVNGTECGEWLGTQSDVIEWAKRTIDDVDSRPFEGRWNECWYEPGTYELNEHGHVVAPGGICSCDYCERRRIQPCANITAGGVCVCSHCMKPHLADPTEAAAENEVVDSGKPAGTCHSGSCTKQGTHRLDWDTWANLACDEHTASWRHVTSPNGTPVKVTPLFRCACCIADADPEGERESERWTWRPAHRETVRATPFVNGNGLVGEYLGQHGHKHRILVTQRGPWYLATIECCREDIHPASGGADQR